MLNYKIILLTLFLLLCRQTLSYAESPDKCLADAKSFTICERLANLGDDEALLILGFLYEKGLGVEKNVDIAEKIYQRLADKNNKEGFNLLAMLKENQGKKNEAIRLYQRAISLGSSAAPYNLGILYKYNSDYISAKKMFQFAITKNNSSNAMMSLGDLYFDGLGVEQNMELAEKWYIESIQAGNVIAITRLGMLYGSLEKYDKAIKYYQLAIEKGDPTAMNSMGLLYQHGFGVKLDINKAIELYQRSADNNDAGGLINLGLMYEEGLGVPQSYEKAIELYERAYQLGYADAQLRIDFLKKNLTRLNKK
ncbi:MAG: sel1 repeat family protein [Providencia sp.]|uniref:SEL1-like repeat protein n=1 Tax=Providencia sp. TaxID=589 RepID=UPI001B5877FA|nr:tetratricopeptide repeat protein [Providencia sp.]MBP6082040.1 sel1 repeat family protein [Providencia sp.]